MTDGSLLSPPEVPGLIDLTVLARGGYATVYRAEQESVGRDVAVKIENRTLETDRDRKRFLREARAAGRMSSHPHVVDLFDAGVTSGGHPYLIMELCEGSYADRIREQPLGAAETRDVGTKIADALADAHELGVLHRDVKPANILYSRFGEPALADFGLAVLAEARDSSITLEVLTPAFAPPEMFAQGAPGPAVDVYSLCASLYAFMAGRPPRWPERQEPSLASLMDLFDLEIPSLPGVPEEFVGLLRRGMRNDPAGRPTAADLRDLLADLPLGAPPRAPLPAASARRPVPPDDRDRRRAAGDGNSAAEPGSGRSHRADVTAPMRTQPVSPPPSGAAPPSVSVPPAGSGPAVGGAALAAATYPRGGPLIPAPRASGTAAVPVSPAPAAPPGPGAARPVSPGPLSPGPVSPGPLSPGPVSPGPIAGYGHAGPPGAGRSAILHGSATAAGHLGPLATPPVPAPPTVDRSGTGGGSRAVLLLSAAVLLVLAALAAGGAWYAVGHRAPATRATATASTSPRVDGSTVPVAAAPVGVDCGLPGDARCPGEPECYGTLYESGGYATAAGMRCDLRHTWEVYAVGTLPADQTDLRRSAVRGDQRVRAVCNEVVLLSRLPLDQALGWRTDVLGPTRQQAAAGDRTFRCLAGRGPDKLTAPAFTR